MSATNDYGSELVNIEQSASDFARLRGFPFNPGLIGGSGADLGPYFISILTPLFRASSSLILYFAPGRYLLKIRPDGEPYDFPEHVQLFFASGALLRPNAGVDVIIRGSLRADKQQIFGYDRAVPLPEGVAGVNTAPLGRILLWSRLIPEVYPEWWGAFGPPNVASQDDLRRVYDSSDAIQAAINAACVHRDDPRTGVRRPALPVVLSDSYQCNRTLVVECPDRTDDLSLILRGGVGLTPKARPYSIVRVRDTVGPAGPRKTIEPDDCVLRLGPGVDFDFQDLSFFTVAGTAGVDGCLDLVGDLKRPRPRRGLLRRFSLVSGSLFGLRVTEPNEAALQHLVLDSCLLGPMNVGYLTVAALRLHGPAGLMVHLDGGLMGTGILDVNLPLPAESAAIVQEGVSLLVRATQFHGGNGPRPSRMHPGTDEVDLTVPDGQEVFLGRSPGPTQALAAQFTALQTESQGWWFLSRPFQGNEQVVLLAVSHTNPNWVGCEPRYKAQGGFVLESVVHKPAPPSVVWLGKGGLCVLIACRFRDSVLTDGDAVANLTNVATFFWRGLPQFLDRPQFFRRLGAPGAISHPPQYEQLFNPASDDVAFDGVIGRVRLLRESP